MFGIFALMLGALYLGYKCIRSIRNDYRKAFPMPEYYNLVYQDLDYNFRLCADDKIVYIQRNKQNDLVITRNCEELYNLSEIERYGLEEKVKNGEEYVICIDNRHYTKWTGDTGEKWGEYVEGRRYKNTRTGDIYVIRKLNNRLYYMDVSTKRILDWTQGEYKRFNALNAVRDTFSTDHKYPYKSQEEEEKNRAETMKKFNYRSTMDLALNKYAIDDDYTQSQIEHDIKGYQTPYMIQL